MAEIESGASASESTPATGGTRPRRRAAARPAGPPVADTAGAGIGADAAASGKQTKPNVAKRARSKSAAAAEKVSETSSSAPTAAAPAAVLAPIFQAPEAPVAPKRARVAKPTNATEPAEAANESGAGLDVADSSSDAANKRRRRGGRGRGKGKSGAAAASDDTLADETGTDDTADDDGSDSNAEDAAADGSGSSKRRRRRRRAGSADGESDDESGDVSTVVHVRQSREQSGRGANAGSVRLEARKQRRRDGRDGARRRTVITEAEFLARRESVERVMVVRDREGITQIGVLEDGILVEHYVTQAGSTSLIGNVYLGKVQNVLPSMEAAFVDIGRGRNGVLYAGEINWDLLGIPNGPERRIENVLKSGETVLVQVSKDPVGQKGARLTAMVSLPGRYIVYVPNSSTTGISRKLPESERNRLKSVLRATLPEDGGVIVRTAAEGASEEDLSRDVTRLLAQWQDIQTKVTTASAPSLLYSEPDMTIKVVRDIFNEDVKALKVQGSDAYEMLEQYIGWVAPDLMSRLEKWVDKEDIFTTFRVDEQLAKALDRKVYLPSGGSLVIDRTEAMTVVDVNTGRFIGSGGNLEETVTKNNLEAAEEIVRQLRLRDIGGIIVIDFIDMVLESNREQVLRRLIECLGRDRTKHQVAEVTSLGLVQMTRKRLSQGLLEVFSTPCDSCGGRGVHVNSRPAPVKEDRHEFVREKAETKPTTGKGSKSGKHNSKSNKDSGATQEPVGAE